MKKTLLLILLTITLNSFAQHSIRPQFKVFNWGVKAGFESLSMNYYNVFEGDTELSISNYNNQTGFHIASFVRVNINRIFMQPELDWTLCKQELSFTLLSEENINFSSQYRSGRVNVLIGYNIIKNGPFVLDFTVGPSFLLNYKSQHVLPKLTLHNDEAYYQTYGIVGFSISISKVHFDIRYKLSTSNSDISFADIPECPDFLQNVLIKKRENVLSFSCGVMF